MGDWCFLNGYADKLLLSFLYKFRSRHFGVISAESNSFSLSTIAQESTVYTSAEARNFN